LKLKLINVDELMSLKTYHFTNKKNDFAEVSENLVRYKSENNFLLDFQNNYVRCSSIIGHAAKSFDILATDLSVHNYLIA